MEGNPEGAKVVTPPGVWASIFALFYTYQVAKIQKVF